LSGGTKVRTERQPGLHWGIKASFLDYVSRMSDGRGTISGGATPTDGNVVIFQPAPDVVPPPLENGVLFFAFRGDVRFAGHSGLLYVRVADPWIVVRGREGELTVLDPYKPDEAPRLPLVRFTIAPESAGSALSANTDGADSVGWTSTDVRLAEEATALFNDVYPPGELFEPLAVFVTAPPSREETP
jgi:Htaa